MISNATGEGATYLTEEEELTYEWYREIIFCDRRTGRIFKPYLQPFALVAAVIVSHHPHRPPGTRYDVHVFGLRDADRERSYIPADVFFERLKEEAAYPEKELPPVTPRYSWPGEALTLDEIRERITVWRVDPKLRQRIDAHNQPWRRGRTDCRTAHDEEVLKMIEDTERTSPDLLTEVRALRDEVRGVRTAMRDLRECMQGDITDQRKRHNPGVVVP